MKCFTHSTYACMFIAWLKGCQTGYHNVVLEGFKRENLLEYFILQVAKLCF